LTNKISNHQLILI